MGTTANVLAPKFRRPFHYVSALLRTLEADVRDPLYVVFLLFAMGHAPFEKVTPDGFPDTVEAWGRSLLPRWRFASALLADFRTLLGGGLPGVHVPGGRVLAKLDFAQASDRAGLARRMNERVLGLTLTSGEEESLQGFIDGRTDVHGGALVFEALALAASLPGFQWY
jgi:hypothetical protein